MDRTNPIFAAKFWSRVVVKSDFQCWIWTGRKGPRGYGRCVYNGQSTGAHRIAFQLVVGDIPDGLLIRHSCDNPSCCNPRHLLPGTAKQNAGDAVERGRVASGARNGKSKLTPQQVIEIKTNPHGLKLGKLAEKFGVSKATVSLVRSGQRWKKLVGAAGVEPATSGM